MVERISKALPLYHLCFSAAAANYRLEFILTVSTSFIGSSMIHLTADNNPAWGFISILFISILLVVDSDRFLFTFNLFNFKFVFGYVKFFFAFLKPFFNFFVIPQFLNTLVLSNPCLIFSNHSSVLSNTCLLASKPLLLSIS